MSSPNQRQSLVSGVLLYGLLRSVLITSLTAGMGLMSGSLTQDPELEEGWISS